MPLFWIDERPRELARKAKRRLGVNNVRCLLASRWLLARGGALFVSIVFCFFVFSFLRESLEPKFVTAMGYANLRR